MQLFHASWALQSSSCASCLINHGALRSRHPSSEHLASQSKCLSFPVPFTKSMLPPDWPLAPAGVSTHLHTVVLEKLNPRFLNTETAALTVRLQQASTVCQIHMVCAHTYVCVCCVGHTQLMCPVQSSLDTCCQQPPWEALGYVALQSDPEQQPYSFSLQVGSSKASSTLKDTGSHSSHSNMAQHWWRARPAAGDQCPLSKFHCKSLMT